MGFVLFYLFLIYIVSILDGPFFRSFCIHLLACAGGATIWPCLIICFRSVFASWGYSLGRNIWLGKGKYWHLGRHPGGSPILSGGWGLCSVIFICFYVFLSTGVGLGIGLGLNWLNRVIPSLT